MDMLNIDEEYDAAAAGFIRRAHAAATPFFFYFCSHHTHVPQFAGRGMEGYSPRGLMGDSLSMLDRSVGRLMNLTAELAIDEKTLMIFSADSEFQNEQHACVNTPLNYGTPHGLAVTGH
jgi:arylsulfatase A-like enzyme